MDTSAYRSTQREQDRITDLARLIPKGMATLLDAGALDGYLSVEMTKYFDTVTALDLTRPEIDHERVETVQGDITCLDIPDDAFDGVLCSEVLEHIPPEKLAAACKELVRVARNFVLVGVPYRQDIRYGRITCAACGTKNPPWGHVNVLDKKKLRKLFADVRCEEISYVGKGIGRTNFIAAYLMDLAGNPYGARSDGQTCIKCKAALSDPVRPTLLQLIFSKIACTIMSIQAMFSPTRPGWMHVLFMKH